MWKDAAANMKVHQFPRAFWDHVQPVHESSSSSTFVPAAVVCKRLRSLASKMADEDNTDSFSSIASYDIKSFIRPESGPRRLSPAYSSEDISCIKSDTNNPSAAAQAETHPGGTRWNPTQEQIGILEMLYKGGMRTPNAHQIEQIAEKLAKYGKIEGKNVFYWFQNHKARERQKQKRERLAGHSHFPICLNPPSSTELAIAKSTITSMLNSDIVAKEDYHDVGASEGAHKRRCRSWTMDHSTDNELNGKERDDAIKNRSCRSDDEGSVCRTLQLFPLHPEGKR